MNDPFFLPELVSNTTACALSHSDSSLKSGGGFCGTQIHSDCLRIDHPGTVRVSLSAPPAVWFETLSRLGEVLYLSRNSIGILGQLKKLPMVRGQHTSPLWSDASGDMQPNLSEHAALWAIRETSPVGVLYGFEAWDLSKMAFDRYVLSDGANFPLFKQFVVQYQSPIEKAINWFPPNHAHSMGRRTSLEHRIPKLRWHVSQHNSSIIPLPTHSIFKLFQEAARIRLELCLTLLQPSMIRSVTWTPDTIPLIRETPDTISFMYGQNTGFHLDTLHAGSVWLWRGRCSRCSKDHWRIEIGDVNDHVGLTIRASNETAQFPLNLENMI
jgi:hypothetical protein